MPAELAAFVIVMAYLAVAWFWFLFADDVGGKSTDAPLWPVVALRHYATRIVRILFRGDY